MRINHVARSWLIRGELLGRKRASVWSQVLLDLDLSLDQLDVQVLRTTTNHAGALGDETGELLERVLDERALADIGDRPQHTALFRECHGGSLVDDVDGLGAERCTECAAAGDDRLAVGEQFASMLLEQIRDLIDQFGSTCDERIHLVSVLVDDCLRLGCDFVLKPCQSLIDCGQLAKCPIQLVDWVGRYSSVVSHDKPFSCCSRCAG